MARSESHVEQFTDTADLDDLHESMDWGFTGEVQSGEEQRRIFNFRCRDTDAWGNWGRGIGGRTASTHAHTCFLKVPQATAGAV